MKTGGIILGACVLALAACSGGAPSEPAAVAATGSAADAALVCHHYMKQRAWVRGLVHPTLADGIQIRNDIAIDVIQSEGTGKLHDDLQAMYRTGKAGHDIHAASTRVYNDCAALGITG
jgi:ABC-type glycerol-3-phosphate transport system substrate-binding protein